MQQPDRISATPDASAAMEPATSPWQYSLAQLIGLTGGLALLLGSAIGLFRQREPFPAGMYLVLVVLAVGVVVASALRQTWRPIVGAVGGSALGLALYAIIAFLPASSTTATGGSRTVSPWMLCGFFAAALLTAVPGALAAGAREYREIPWWRWVCILVGLTLGFSMQAMVGFSGGLGGSQLMSFLLAIPFVLVQASGCYFLVSAIGLLCWIEGYAAITIVELLCGCWSKARASVQQRRTP